MKNKLSLILIACLWMSAMMAANAQATMAGRLKSYNGGKGLLVLQLEDNSTRTFQLSDKTKVEWNGRASSVSALPVGAKISVQVIGSLGSSPLKAGKIVDWGNSEKIVAKGAKDPYYTAVGAYASTNGTGGVPDGAPVGQHAASHTLAAVGLGGSINQPTQSNMPVGQDGPPDDRSYSSMGQQPQSTQYQNQGDSMTAPLEQLQMSPYGTAGQSGSNPAANPNANAYPNGSASGMYGTDPGAMGMSPADAAAMGIDPSALGMNPAMNPNMGGMDPSMGATNPYGQTNLGQGQSSSLMGMDESDSEGGDVMDVGSTGYGNDGGKITARILQADLKKGFLMVQSFSNPQPQRILLGAGSSAPTHLLVPGQMVDITGRPTANGFQATDIQAATGY